MSLPVYKAESVTFTLDGVEYALQPFGCDLVGAFMREEPELPKRRKEEEPKFEYTFTLQIPHVTLPFIIHEEDPIDIERRIFWARSRRWFLAPRRYTEHERTEMKIFRILALGWFARSMSAHPDWLARGLT